jgi:hypothetical protein
MARQRLHKDPPPDDPTPPAEPAPPAPSEAAEAADPPVADAAPAGAPAPPTPPTASKRKAKAAPPAGDLDAAGKAIDDAATSVGPSTAPTSAASLLAQQLADEIGEKNPLPFTDYPRPGVGLVALVTKVIDEGLGLDLEQEFDSLVADLILPDALTPQAVHVAINQCEDNARRAHRLYALARYQFDRYKIEAEVALGAMRESATHKLAALKAGGHHPKQVTDSDVRDMAAIMYPDEWKDIQDRLARTEHTLAHIARFADLWQRRSWSLSSLNK